MRTENARGSRCTEGTRCWPDMAVLHSPPHAEAVVVVDMSRGHCTRHRVVEVGDIRCNAAVRDAVHCVDILRGQDLHDNMHRVVGRGDPEGTCPAVEVRDPDRGDTHCTAEDVHSDWPSVVVVAGVAVPVYWK